MPARNPGNADTVLRRTYDRTTGALRVVTSLDTLSPADIMVQNPGNADEVLRMVYDPATGALKTSGGGQSPLLVAGAPTSGQAGSIPGRLALDTSQTPNIVYVNVGTAVVSSWMGLLSGAVIP